MKRKHIETAKTESKVFRARPRGPALQFEFPGFTTGMRQATSSQGCSMQDCLEDLDELVGPAVARMQAKGSCVGKHAGKLIVLSHQIMSIR